MNTLFIVLAVVGFVFGVSILKISTTMSNGPREGVRNGGAAVSIIVGLVVGLVASLFFSPVSFAAVFHTTVLSIGATLIAYLVPLATYVLVLRGR